MDFRAGRAADGSRDPSTIDSQILHTVIALRRGHHVLGIISTAEGNVASSPPIRLGEMVVFFEGREAIGFDRMKDKGIWQCRHGAFHHGDVVRKPFGSRVFSRTSKGFVYALSPTPELWSQVVPNRTQIVQDFDQSIVIFHLDLKPGDVVVESGTGSGVMSSSIIRTIAPSGFLHTFEFNGIRATKAREEFAENGLGALVNVVHRDACATREEGGGFGEELAAKADAVFLDLPEPWLAVAHAKVALKPGKKLCSYSPCIEQVMKTCEALRNEGFNSVTTIEFRLRSFGHSEIKLEVPDFGYSKANSQKGTTSPKSDSVAPHQAASHATASLDARETTASNGEGVMKDGVPVITKEGGGASAAEKAGPDVVEVVTQGDSGACGLEGQGSSGGNIAADNDADSDRRKQDIVPVPDSSIARKGQSDDVSVTKNDAAKVSHKRPRENVDSKERQPSDRTRSWGISNNVDVKAAEGIQSTGSDRRKPPPKAAGMDASKPPVHLVCAQPYPIMRGHTAFLTFATTPVLRQKSVSLNVKEDGIWSPHEEAEAGSSSNNGDPTLVVDDSKRDGGARGDSAMEVEMSAVDSTEQAGNDGKMNKGQRGVGDGSAL